MLAINFFVRRKKLIETEEFNRLEKKFFSANPEMGINGILLVFLAIFGYSAYHTSAIIIYGQIETWLGIFLVFSIISAVANSINLLRTNELPKILYEEKYTTSLSKPSDAVNRKANSGIKVITLLLIAEISFVVGLLMNHRRK